MYVLIGGDIRPHVIDALQFLVEKIKTECVTELNIRPNLLLNFVSERLHRFCDDS